MSGWIIAFIVIYCLLLCTYFITETSGKMYLRAPNKIAMAVMFFAFAAYQFTVNPARFSIQTYTVLLIIGIFLSAFGDILLLFDFKVGGTFFLSGNICIFFYYICLLTNSGHPATEWWWVFLILAVLLATWIFLFVKSKLFNFKGHKELMVFMPFYLLSVMAHGITGIALMVFLPGQYTLLAIGSILFMLSDFALMVNEFAYPNKWVLRSNSALYFSGLLLMVLSMAIIC